MSHSHPSPQTPLYFRQHVVSCMMLVDPGSETVHEQNCLKHRQAVSKPAKVQCSYTRLCSRLTVDSVMSAVPKPRVGLCQYLASLPATCHIYLQNFLSEV